MASKYAISQMGPPPFRLLCRKWGLHQRSGTWKRKHTMTATMSVDEKTALNALPIPTKYGKETLMEPDEIASAINFIISKEARGVNGIIMFVDGGTDALLNSEKVY